MKNAAIWSGGSGFAAALAESRDERHGRNESRDERHGRNDSRGERHGRHESANWSRIKGFISRFVGGDNSAELAGLRDRINALEQANAQLKYQLDARAAPSELARLAYSDCVTGLANRRALQCRAEHEMTRIRRTERPACIVLVDIDHFKAINDDFGHAQGDAVLRGIAGTLKAQTRATDTLARWGGDEFALLLPETDVAAAQFVAEKCRQAVQALTLDLPRCITITLGVSALFSIDTFDAALARADGALYEGKVAGRNRVAVLLGHSIIQ